MRVAVSGDHAGFELKNTVAAWLKDWGHEVQDLGAHTYDRDDDYPDFAGAAAVAVAEGRADRAVIICGSGVGACVVANKVPGVRAAICHDTYSAHQGVEHDDMNVLCIGGRIIGLEVAREVVAAFMDAVFSREDRHERRLRKLQAIEAQYADATRVPRR